MANVAMLNAIEPVFRQPAAQAIGWALLQFVWQGAAVGALTAVALLALRRGAADVRYLVASIGMALMLTLPIVTAVQKYQTLTRVQAPSSATTNVATPGAPIGRADSAATGASSTAGAGADLVATDTTASVLPLPPAVRSFEPALMLAWLAGVTFLTLRLLTGWIWVQRMRTHGVAPVEPSWQRMLSRLSRQLHITRAIALMQSTAVDVPTVIGWIRPVVLLPVSALGGLAPQQLEAILAHELAHIRRHDYLVNLLQTLVETLLFYHPAVWWVSRRIRVERENCCDDLAVSLCGDPVAYANALADLESLRSSFPPYRRLDRVAMAATGGSLLHRVRRLLGAPASHTGHGPAWLAGSVALVLVAGITLGADGAARAQTPAAPHVAAPAASTPAVAATASVATAEPALARVAAAPAAPAIGSMPVARAAEAPEAPEVPEAAQVAPAPAAPAIAQSQHVSISQHTDDSSGNWIWSSNGEKLQVNYAGKFDFTDDDADIREMSPGGSLKISDGAWFGRHSIEIVERNGQIEHHYYVNGSERPYEPEGHAWLRENLPRFVRNTAIAAPSRVARMLKTGGVPAVLTEIGRIDGTWAKGVYYRELFKQGSLTPAQYRDAMVQAGREMHGSDYELAQLLIAVADHLPNDDTSRAAYFSAASGLTSAYETRRVYSTMLKKGAVPPQVLAGILEQARKINSDYDMSELLRQIVAGQKLDDRNRDAFFAAVAALHSDYERHRVLTAVMRSAGPNDRSVVEASLAQAEKLTSDYESAAFLTEVLKQGGVEGSVRAPFFRVLDSIKGSYDRGRVLEAVVRKPDVSHDTMLAVLRASRGLGNYELSQVLVAAAQAQPMTGDLRDAYLDAADKLGSYEQGQVMTALVKSERRRQ